jgi:signal transduction histidine kinase
MGDIVPDAEARNRALLEAGLTLASELDLDHVLRRIVELAMEITNARYGALGILGDDRRIETFLTVGVDDATRNRIGDPPTGHGILGLLIEEALPLRLADIQRDPRAYGFPPNHPPMHSFLGAPVRALGRVFGNIYLTEKQGADTFGADDEEALVVLAAQAGVAIQNARLYAEMQHAQRELRRLEVLEDRERIAKELHDGVIQSLFAVGMGLQGTAAMSRDVDLSRRIEGAVEEVDRAIRDLRNYIFGLRPGILADRELDKALRELAAEFAERTSVVTVVNVDESVAAELASSAADVIQLTREALSNVGRHAQASTCSVSLFRRDDVTELVIDDDGVGFVTDSPHEGMGMANLRGRVERMGGSFTIESVRGEGTTVRVRLPR